MQVRQAALDPIILIKRRSNQLNEILEQDNHSGVPGFETVQVVGRDDQLIQRVARKQLTKHLGEFGASCPKIYRITDLRVTNFMMLKGSVIEPLSRETTLAVSLNFGESAGMLFVSHCLVLGFL